MGDNAKGRSEEGLQNLFQSWLFVRVEKREALPIDRFQPPQNHRVEQRFFGSIVVMDGRQVHFSVRNDGSQRDASKAVLREQSLGRVQDPLFGMGFGFHSSHTND